MNNIMTAIAFFSVASPVIARTYVPDPCASYAKSFHSVADQIEKSNGMALTYPGIEPERNRLWFYQQINKKLAPLISCLEDHESEISDYYQ